MQHLQPERSVNWSTNTWINNQTRRSGPPGNFSSSAALNESTTLLLFTRLWTCCWTPDWLGSAAQWPVAAAAQLSAQRAVLHKDFTPQRWRRSLDYFRFVLGQLQLRQYLEVTQITHLYLQQILLRRTHNREELIATIISFTCILNRPAVREVIIIHQRDGLKTRADVFF